MEISQIPSFMRGISLKNAIIFKGLLLIFFFLHPPSVFADTPLTAGVVLEKMNSDERFGYIAGIVTGFAYARFQKDGKDETGMTCLSDWFYGSGETAFLIEQAFEKYPDYPPAVIVWTLARKECGE